MSRWRRRPKHEKVGICLVQEMQRLSNALNNIPNADRPQYVMEWVQEQRDKGIDHEVLDNLEHGSRHAEKLWKLGGIISPNMLDEFVPFAVMVIRVDSPFPEETKQHFRAALQELLGPDVKVGGLPPGYTPSWEKEHG